MKTLQCIQTITMMLSIVGLVMSALIKDYRYALLSIVIILLLTGTILLVTDKRIEKLENKKLFNKKK
jgi:undecaprenyl pyrophosphate phosphatase UppP